ncbi:LAGLIDADG family homing endonuclease [Gammaproteobacteria bacterium]|nr:LAGLIDADG family homing endonuclease [Gammaproteobacteria bacterium]
MYKEVKLLAQTDTAYIAGLIDGEGTVTLSRRHRNENRQLVVSISNTDRPLLEYVLTSIGAGKITGKITYQSHHTASYTYTISNRQGLALLKQILPYLKTYKAKRSDLILRDYIRLTPRNGRYTPEIKQARTDFENKVMKIKC